MRVIIFQHVASAIHSTILDVFSNFYDQRMFQVCHYTRRCICQVKNNFWSEELCRWNFVTFDWCKMTLWQNSNYDSHKISRNIFWMSTYKNHWFPNVNHRISDEMHGWSYFEISLFSFHHFEMSQSDFANLGRDRRTQKKNYFLMGYVVYVRQFEITLREYGNRFYWDSFHDRYDFFWFTYDAIRSD